MTVVASRTSLRGISRRFGALLGVVSFLAMGVALAGAQSAMATDYHFSCGTPIPSNSWCAAPEVHTYGYLEVFLPSGYQRTTHKCAKLTTLDGVTNYARRCDTNHHGYVWVYSDGGGLAPYPNNSVSMKALGANGDNGGDYHSVQARATY